MNLSQLEVLVAIADAGTLSEAAEVVSLTQSAVSYSLSRLEAELGVTLMDRGRQGITLTPIGEEVVQHARSILGQVEIIRQKTARELGLSTGKLRFGCVPTVPGRLLTGILRSFQHKYPEIEIVLFEGNPFELVEWLGNAVIDVATVTRPDDYAFALPFVHTEVVAVMAAAHPLAILDEIPIDQLNQEPLIGPKFEYGMLNHLIRQQDMTLPRLRYAVSTQTTILSMVRENMGIALMPDILLDTHSDELAVRPLLPALKVDIFLATNVRSPAVDAFMVTVSGWAKEHGFWSDNS